MKCKKVIMIFLVTLMTVSSMACTREVAKEKNSDVSVGTAQGSNSDGDELVDIDDLPKLTLFVDETWWPYDVWEGEVPEEFSRRVGVNLEIIRAADENQLPLMVTSGDMVDMVCTGRYQYMADADISYALDELTDEYSNIDFKVDPVYQFVNQAPDGHYYTIGAGYSPDSEYEKYDSILSEGAGFMVRQDLIEELGLEINTLEDLDKVFAAAKEAYPEMATCSFNPAHQFNWLMDQMGLKNNNYYDNNGSLEWYLRQEGLLDYYKKVNEWYRKGFITAENFAYQSEDEVKELCVGGKSFANFGYDNHADNYNTAIKENNDDFRFSLITETISENRASYDTSSGWRGLYITKSCTDVENAFKVLSYAYSDEGMRLLMWGIEGEDYTLDDKGYPVFSYDFQGDNSVLQSRGLKYWGWLVHNSIVTSIAEATSDSQTAIARKNKTPYVKRNPVIGMIRFETDSDEANISSKLGELVKNQQINIYMADSEEACETAFNNMLQTAIEIGMLDLEGYGNEVYPELKAQYDAIVAGR